MAKNKAVYKLVVKNGDQEYNLSKKTGQYEYKTVDYVEEFGDLGEALAELLVYINDSYNENRVSLVFTPEKRGKK